MMESTTFRLLTCSLLRCCRRAKCFEGGRRTFLSDAYWCQDIWNTRTSLPIFRDLNMDKFYLAMDKNFQTRGKVLPVDIDLFALCATSDQHLDDLQDLVHRFRRTSQTAGVLPSTSHLVVRAFVAASADRRLRLLDMLDDRVNYGVFLDHNTASMLMDTFVREGNTRDAAKIATHLMLQEDWDNPISKTLALHCCYAYVQNPVPEPWQEPEPEEDPNAETEYVRVKYLRNKWHDGHFDLREAADIVGKTLAWIGATVDDVGGHSCELLGWTMYSKWQELVQCCDRLQGGDGVCQDVIGRVTGLLSAAGEQCPDAAALSARVASLPTVPAPLGDALRLAVERAVAEHEVADVVRLRQLYAEWQQRRQHELELQRQAADRERRVQALEEKRQYLRERERLLWFFDNEEPLLAEVERQWNRPQLPKPPIVQKLLRKKRQTEEDYVPPSVRRSHNK
ncbi:uncharacterized protein LOC119102588 [Pollicipes pollicipes]|uniref:uncharacterized protein LOC119102588 n=1 Tax=Pollicipes pollicipes TaxID=41117 RepID=UPI001885699D|nr:uncharacterized protein LOC119102588 [Pollicipes pollicipes]XP_037081910.1 uncharacterized protein LOC119102588 [Pollicipes pollicipes]XP_037081911.1 uncharacterized protein LOC119102588 [Pollicipes pollicipes]XP_037081913.1 uncharacterized protein LOC119102588 [Pollicipes pollicipes]XP_037081914.1 uncharacterized protein LOC119102588 [Pollicipes pollicipes]XP_037081915.1 uncharacterized protein LOC119102588 [Pollicipes pollicipes]XP_037081916.1 uncharacterized protein LOC119102588 [Pollic